jgi:hypothetical protein
VVRVMVVEIVREGGEGGGGTSGHRVLVVADPEAGRQVALR